MPTSEPEVPPRPGRRGAGRGAPRSPADRVQRQEPAERVKVKICGVVDPRNACLAVEMGADLLGLNFARESPRRLTWERAREIAREVAGRAVLVGVFVNQEPGEVEEIAARVGLDLVQLSGDEGPEQVAGLAPRAIKALRTGGDPGAEALAAWAGCWGLLFDAPHGVLHGGTGEAWDYAAVGRVMRSRVGGGTRGLGESGGPGEPGAVVGEGEREGGPRFLLAGGIGPDNVRQAIAACRPYAVDVCSRVESAPGIKDPALLRRLFEEVKHGPAATPA